MTIRLTGIYTPPLPETRDLAMIEVDHNNITYNWQMYIPQSENIQAYIDSQELRIKAEIDAKEVEWTNLNPRYKITTNPLTGEEVKSEISKDEIVCPEIPDYYAKRRDAYPPLGDQIDAIWKGVDSPDFLAIQKKIQEVKATYPKL
jgi:hypothetical protein